MIRTIISIIALSLLLGATSCGSSPPEFPSGTPAPAVIHTGECLHIVRQGESLNSIARQYNVTEKALRDRNRGGAAAGVLEVGTELWIPPNKPEVRRIEPAASPQ